MGESDKELLELAAKAIGAQYDHAVCCISIDGGINWSQWEPLESCCDAAILLGIIVGIYGDKLFLIFPELYGDKKVKPKDINDRNAILKVCRAIVRSAAEIGKS